MPTRRNAATLTTLVALGAAILPVGAGAFPVGSPGRVLPRANGAPASSLVREYVRSTGVYDVSVTITAPASHQSIVRLRIGSITRHALTSGRAHRARVSVQLQISRRVVTIRAAAASVKPQLRVSLVKVAALAPGTPAPSTTSGRPKTGGTTRASSGTGPTGPTGATATGATGATGPAGTTPPSGSGGSGGSSGSIIVPGGFAAVDNYSSLVKDYEFNGSSLPSDWSTGNANYGYQATQFQPSQVTMTGSSVALTANDQPNSAGMPYEGGWISTAGHFTLTHGMIDFRAWVPGGQGLWSGLWGVNPAGTTPLSELDVQEMLLGDTHTVHGSLHNWGSPYWVETQSARDDVDLSAGYHDYEVVWQPGMVSWAIDNIVYAQYTEAQATAAGEIWPFDSPNGIYLIADLAVGSASEWSGAPDGSTQFPATMQIQYVKVWQ